MTNTSTAYVDNWNRFAQHHQGDWHGDWVEYSPEGSIVKAFRCIRSFHLSEDGEEIAHQNHYIYPDGKEETETFKPYPKPIAKSLFLENSFSWGSKLVASEGDFGFETGFRFETKRTSLAVIYNEKGSLGKIVAIAETLAEFSEVPTLPKPEEFGQNWQGTITKITPNWIVSSSESTTWQPLTALNPDYRTLYLTNGLALHCPPQVQPEQEFILAVDWLVNSTLLHRGIRHFDHNGFKAFTLEVFTRD